jgi:muconate cycloisomerase
MRLKSVIPIAVRLPLARPVSMAGVTLREADNLLIRIEDELGNVGWGEAASAPTMTGETLAGMLAAAEFLRPRLEDAAVEDLETFSGFVDRLIYGNSSVKAAIDIALHDLAGRRQKVPLHDLLGGKCRDRVAVLHMLATGDRSSDLADARARAAGGYQAYKVKVGVAGPAGRVQRDIERCAEIRAALGPGIRISADANQGYERGEGVAFAKSAEAAGLDFIEQPIHGADLEGMQQIVAAGPVPVGADEGIHSIADIDRHHSLKAAHGGSLKIIKLGGIGGVIRGGRRAHALGMHVNLASKTAESSIANAAIVHAAVALPQVDWDVNVTHDYLVDDLTSDPMAIEDGHVAPPDRPGLGVQVDEARVLRFAYRV